MAIASFHAPVRIFSSPSYSPSLPTRTPNTKHLLFRRTTRLRTQNRRNPRQKAKHRPSDTFQPLLSSVSLPLRGHDINLEILGIAVPAMLALAADPIALLVDTAFVGHLGSRASGHNDFAREIGYLQHEPNGEVDGESRKSLPAVSTSLALAAAVGILESIGLIFGLRMLMDFMGITVDSPMRLPAEQFLTLRAFGAPAIVMTLAAQGTFCGFKDTKSPLYAVCI